MRRTNLLLCILGSLWFNACTDDSNVLPEPAEKCEADAFASARAIANQAMIDFGFGVKSRSVSDTNVEILFTDSALSDTAAYIVNYKDGGFAIVNPNAETQVYAISVDGSYQPGVIPASDAYMAAIIGGNRPVKPTPLPLDSMVIQQPDPDFLHPPYTNVYENLTPTWYQSDPFNRYCPLISYLPQQRALTGCTPLAIAEVCSVKNYPERIGDRFFDWNEIRTAENIEDLSATSLDNLAFIISKIGSYAGTTYEPLTSSTTFSGALKACKSLGFQNAREINTSDDLRNELKKKSPVCMFGTHAPGKEDEASHTWVGDGLMIHGRYIDNSGLITDFPIPSGYEETYYVHCNWGWGGTNNGYFVLGTSYSVNSYKFEKLRILAF